jgi:hypothetical protein
MSTQADHRHELVPRPGQTPDGLRAAVAVVDPGHLAEMQRTKDEAFAKAVEWQSLSPVRRSCRSQGLEIARRPPYPCQKRPGHEDPAVAEAALRELSAVLDEAMKAVRA